MVKKRVCIPRSFLVIDVRNLGKTYAHPVFLFVYKLSLYVFIARAMCGLTHVAVVALCSCSPQK